MSAGELFLGLPVGRVVPVKDRSIEDIERRLRAHRTEQRRLQAVSLLALSDGLEEFAQEFPQVSQLELFAGLDDIARRRAEAETVRGWSAANERVAAREEEREPREPLPVEHVMWRLLVIGVMLDQRAEVSRLEVRALRALGHVLEGDGPFDGHEFDGLDEDDGPEGRPARVREDREPSAEHLAWLVEERATCAAYDVAILAESTEASGEVCAAAVNLANGTATATRGADDNARRFGSMPGGGSHE